MHKFLIALLITFGTADVVPQQQDQLPQTTTETVVEVSQSFPVINNAAPDEIELVNEAVRRFGVAGMQLPAVEITFSDTREACGGYRGLFEHGTTNDPVDQITICDDWPVYLYHELAHAWEHHTVTEVTRAELLNHWQLNTWSDQDEDWDARGIEQAAKAISYALAFDALPVDINVGRYVCAFELLTGTPLPDDVPVTCAGNTTAAATPASAVSTAAPMADSGAEKDPAHDPRLSPTSTTESPETGGGTNVPWSENEGPGSNSLHASRVTTTTAP